MATDVSILCLDGETIEYILQNDCLEFSDVLNFSLTCQRFSETVMTNNVLWKKKFFQRWPHLYEIYEPNEKDEQQIHSWIETIQSSIQCRKKLITALSFMSQKDSSKQELAYAVMKEFKVSLGREKHPYAYYFVIDELTTLINSSNPDINLTHQYYARKLLSYLNRAKLAVEWNHFKSLPVENQILEKGAIIISQWSQPDKRVSESQVTAILDGIAETVKLAIKARYPTHPLLFASKCDLDKWRTTIIPDNKWDREATKQVMNVLCEVIFEDLKFYGNSETYYSSENSFIEKVLENKRGTPVTLAIVFESVARRLGLRCELACFTGHFLLHFKEKYCHSQDEDVKSIYIDVLSKGKLLTSDNCPRMAGASKCPIAKFNFNQAAAAEKVLDRIANHLVTASRQITLLHGRVARCRSALELAIMIDPHDMNKLFDLAQFYIQYKVCFSDIWDTLRNFSLTADQLQIVVNMFKNSQKRNNTEVTPTKLRCPTVKYAIGMIMKNRMHGQFHVIVGWDLRRIALPRWTVKTIVSDVPDVKPFYTVLTEDGAYEYVAEDHLEISPINMCINHDEIGKYFYKYCGNYYLPNERMEQEYPEDADVRNQLLSQNSCT